MLKKWSQPIAYRRRVRLRRFLRLVESEAYKREPKVSVPTFGLTYSASSRRRGYAENNLLPEHSDLDFPGEWVIQLRSECGMPCIGKHAR